MTPCLPLCVGNSERLMVLYSRLRQTAMILAFSCLMVPEAGAESCKYNPDYQKPALQHQLVINPGKVIRVLSPSFFAFNLDWPRFQLSWFKHGPESEYKELVDYLRASPGAIYRYPGGTVS